MRSRYLRRYVEQMKHFAKPEGIEWVEKKLAADPAYRREVRKRVTAYIRYNERGEYWYRKRSEHRRKYRTDPAFRKQNTERCRTYRARRKMREQKEEECLEKAYGIMRFFDLLRRLPPKTQVEHLVKLLPDGSDDLVANLRNAAATWDDVEPERRERRTKAIAELVDLLQEQYLEASSAELLTADGQGPA